MTNIDVSRTDRNSVGQQAVLDQMLTGTLLKFSSESSSSQYSFFQTTGVTKNSTEYNFGVNYLANAGSLFSNSQNLSMAVALMGSQGNQGAQGNQGNQGAQGNQGNQGAQGAQGNQGV